MTLQEFFWQNSRVALGFSGGVDSAFLLYAAAHYGAQVGAYYVKTAFQPEFELRDAERMVAQLAKETGRISFRVIEADVLSDKTIQSNPSDRCYYCKKKIFGLICEAAAADGYPVILDGTNASDDAADRPGMRALTELSVRSPLRECGITKEVVRQLSKEAGLFTWDKPAYSSLATRIPAGSTSQRGGLARIEQAEAAITLLGFTDFRVRLYGDAARIQLPKAQLGKALEQREKMTAALEPWFDTVLLDLRVCR